MMAVVAEVSRDSTTIAEARLGMDSLVARSSRQDAHNLVSHLPPRYRGPASGRRQDERRQDERCPVARVLQGDVHNRRH